MKNSIKVTESNELDSKTPRSVLELNYKFLEMSELKQELDIMRVEYNRLQNKMKDEKMTYEQDTNKQMDLLMRQGVSLQRVIIDLEEETETLREEWRTSTASSTIKRHTEYFVEKQDAQLYKMLHEVFRALHRTRLTSHFVQNFRFVLAYLTNTTSGFAIWS